MPIASRGQAAVRPSAAIHLALPLLAACVPAGVRRGDDRPPLPPSPSSTRPVPAGRPTTPFPAPAPVARPPAPPPAWIARRVTPDAREVAASRYTVAPGDTLRAVGERTGAGADAIARANGLEPPYPLRAGQVLAIPAGRYHLVRQGESGIAIARAYGVEWSRVVTANALAEPYLLRTGQRLLIPGEAGGIASAAERAAAFTLDIDDILTGGEPAIAEAQSPVRAAPGSAGALPATAALAAPAALKGGFVWPVEGTILRRFGRGAAGMRSDGIDIAVARGTPIKAAADGIVAYSGSEVPSLGGLVIVKHGSGWVSVYGHADRLLVRRGDAVKQGQRVALSGASGSAGRPELHFELRKGRTPVDPTSQLPAR